MTSSPGANGPLGDTRRLCVRSAFGERALPPKPSRDDQLSMWSTFVHRWRRPILHAIAGGAIVSTAALVGHRSAPTPIGGLVEAPVVGVEPLESTVALPALAALVTPTPSIVTETASTN